MIGSFKGAAFAAPEIRISDKTGGKKQMSKK